MDSASSSGGFQQTLEAKEPLRKAEGRGNTAGKGGSALQCPMSRQGLSKTFRRRISPGAGGTVHCLGPDLAGGPRTPGLCLGQCLSWSPLRRRFPKRDPRRMEIGHGPGARNPHKRAEGAVRNLDAALSHAVFCGRRFAMGFRRVPKRGTRQQAEENHRAHAPGQARHERSC